MEPIDLHLTGKQHIKFMKKMPFQLSGGDLKKVSGEHSVRLHLHHNHYNKLLNNAEQNKGYRFTTYEHNEDDKDDVNDDNDMIEGGSLLHQLKLKHSIEDGNHMIHIEGGKINIGKAFNKAFDPKKNGVAKAVNKAVDVVAPVAKEIAYTTGDVIKKSSRPLIKTALKEGINVVGGIYGNPKLGTQLSPLINNGTNAILDKADLGFGLKVKKVRKSKATTNNLTFNGGSFSTLGGSFKPLGGDGLFKNSGYIV